MAENVFIGTSDTLSELPTCLFWIGRALLDGRKQKLPMVVGTSYTFILVWPSASCRKKLKTSDGVRTSDLGSGPPISTEQQSL